MNNSAQSVLQIIKGQLKRLHFISHNQNHKCKTGSLRWTKTGTVRVPALLFASASVKTINVCRNDRQQAERVLGIFQAALFILRWMDKDLKIMAGWLRKCFSCVSERMYQPTPHHKGRTKKTSSTEQTSILNGHHLSELYKSKCTFYKFTREKTILLCTGKLNF